MGTMSPTSSHNGSSRTFRASQGLGGKTGNAAHRSYPPFLYASPYALPYGAVVRYDMSLRSFWVLPLLLLVACTPARGGLSGDNDDSGPQVGNCTASVTYSPSSDLTPLRNYHYGVGGRIDSVGYVFSDGSSAVTDFEYDDDGRLERMSGLLGSVWLVGSVTYSYDSEGQPDIFEYDTDDDGVIDYTYRHTYDDRGLLTRTESPPPSDLSFREEYRYDDDGRLDHTTYSEWNEAEEGWGLVEERFSGYDAAGCLIETLTVAADGDEWLLTLGHDAEGRIALAEFDLDNTGDVGSEFRFDYGDGDGCSPVNAGYPTHQGHFLGTLQPSYVCP
jgi:hypothetical protein